MSPEELRKRLKDWWHVPSRYLDCRFENFDAYDRALMSRLNLVKQVAEERRSALLFGRPGVGKSHLAVATMAQWVTGGARGHFVSALDYVLQVQACYGNPREIVSDLLDDAHFLVLDDLGTQRDSETSRLAILHIIDKVYSDRKRIIVTSNLTPMELDQLEPRVMSRLTEIGALTEIKADDYRLRIAARRQKADVAERFPSTVN